MRFKSSCICDVHFKSKQIQSILKPPTEYRFSFYLNPLKKRGGGGEKKRRKDAGEISIGGLFHKQLNFPFCVSHLILSNMPKAIRPRAHCLNNAQFMSPPHHHHHLHHHNHSRLLQRPNQPCHWLLGSGLQQNQEKANEI